MYDLNAEAIYDVCETKIADMVQGVEASIGFFMIFRKRNPNCHKQK